MGIGLLITFAGLCFLYPRAVMQWFAALFVAGTAAYLTVANEHWIAPLGQFEIWFLVDYILIQVLFSYLNNRKTKPVLAVANDNSEK